MWFNSYYKNLTQNNLYDVKIDMKQMQSYIYKILLAFKNWLFTIFAGFASYLVPLQPLIVVATLMAFLDYMVKLYCILRTQGWDGVKSNRMKDTMQKIVLYAIFLFVVYTVDMLFIKTFFLDIVNLLFTDWLANIVAKLSFTGAAAFMILAREFKSIDENWEQAFGISYIKIISDKFGWMIKLKINDTDTTKNS